MEAKVRSKSTRAQTGLQGDACMDAEDTRLTAPLRFVFFPQAPPFVAHVRALEGQMRSNGVPGASRLTEVCRGSAAHCVLGVHCRRLERMSVCIHES